MAAKKIQKQALCALTFQVEDKRTNHQTSGKVLATADLNNWLHSAIDQWYGHSLANDTTPTASKLRVLIQVEKAYIHHIADTKSAIVASKVTIQGETLRYRGKSTKMNWFGSKTEYENALSLALSNNFQAMSQDIARYCQNNNLSTQGIPLNKPRSE